MKRHILTILLLFISIITSATTISAQAPPPPPPPVGVISWGNPLLYLSLVLLFGVYKIFRKK
ncbi:hypothetical protein ACFL7D_02285 [candidate division KSB1 bacterium]